MGTDYGAVLPPPFLERAARPELGERRVTEGGVRNDALVVQKGYRWVSHGRRGSIFHSNGTPHKAV